MEILGLLIKKINLIATKTLTTGLLLLACFVFVDIDSIIENISKVSVQIIIISFGLVVASFFFMSLRWHKILAGRSGSSFYINNYLYFQSSFFNFFTPANLGGDIYRIVKFKSQMLSRRSILELLLLERTVGFLSILLVLVSSIIISIAIENHAFRSKILSFLVELTVSEKFVGLICFFAIWVVIIWATILMSDWMRKVVRNGLVILLRVWDVFRNNDKRWSIGLSFAGILCWIVSVFIVALSLDVPASFLAITVTVTFTEIIRFLPLTAQGVGVRELSFASMLSVWGHNFSESFAIATISYLILSVCILMCGPIGFFLRSFKEAES